MLCLQGSLDEKAFQNRVNYEDIEKQNCEGMSDKVGGRPGCLNAAVLQGENPHCQQCGCLVSVAQAVAQAESSGASRMDFFFWAGRHWVQALVLYLHVAEAEAVPH